MKNHLTALGLILLLSGCDGCKQKTKETINKGGEVVGQTATEFVEGISEGVDHTLQCEIVLSKTLTDQGLSTGKFTIADNTVDGGYNNQLTLYIIFNKDFDAPVSAKVYDKQGLEAGRTQIQVRGKAGAAGYFDFAFDKRTYIEVKSKVVLE